MKRKVFTDGNGSTAILVEGLGHYAPTKEVIELEERVAELEVQVYFLKNRVKDLEGAKVFAEKWEDEHDAEIAKAAYKAAAYVFTQPWPNRDWTIDFSANEYAKQLKVVSLQATKFFAIL
jgi:hypothetical protein